MGRIRITNYGLPSFPSSSSSSFFASVPSFFSFLTLLNEEKGISPLPRSCIVSVSNPSSFASSSSSSSSPFSSSLSPPPSLPHAPLVVRPVHQSNMGDSVSSMDDSTESLDLSPSVAPSSSSSSSSAAAGRKSGGGVRAKFTGRK